MKLARIVSIICAVLMVGNMAGSAFGQALPHTSLQRDDALSDQAEQTIVSEFEAVKAQLLMALQMLPPENQTPVTEKIAKIDAKLAQLESIDIYHSPDTYESVVEAYKGALNTCIDPNKDALPALVNDPMLAMFSFPSFSQAAMTSLRLLQAQIEPHFLFNTLSNVMTLLDTDVQKARQMLSDLNEYFRISLGRTRKEMVTLGEELDLVKRYLDILKIRMGDRLQYRIEGRGGLREMPFPPLIIQPLVENSIKYGLEPNVNGGEITIDCSKADDMLCIRVSDTGMNLDVSGDQAGIGIDNVTRRLENIYGQRAALTLRAVTPVGVEALIEVPI